MSSDADYAAYLARFESQVGPLAVGAYGKWRGQLVRKLAPDEFAKKNGEFTTLLTTYRKIMERGDTLNDAVTRLLRERQIELVVEGNLL